MVIGDLNATNFKCEWITHLRTLHVENILLLFRRETSSCFLECSECVVVGERLP